MTAASVDAPRGGRAREAAGRGGLVRGAGLVALYLGVATAVTWPLARHAATHVVLANIAALGDPWIIGWALAYQTRALAGLPLPGIFHPTPHSLYYGETAFGALPLFAPAYLATANPILAVNAVFLGGLALTAASLHAVVRRWTGSSTAGAVSAWTFLVCPFSAWAWGPSAVNYVTLWYWPWIVLLAAAPRVTPRTALALGFLVLAQGLTSFYVAVGVMGPLLVLAAWRLARRETRPAGRRLLAVAAIAAAGWGLVFAPHLVVRLENPELGSQTFYPFLTHIAVPSGLFDAGEPSGIAPAALFLIALGAVVATRGPGSQRAAWRSGLFWTGVGLVIALPPRLLVAGHEITTPVGWVAAAGVPVHAVRDNGRRGLAALVGLCMLTGVAWAEVAAGLARRGRAWAAPPLALALAVAIFQGLLRPVERRPSPAPTPGRYALFDAYESARLASPLMTILGEPGGPVLELPTAPGPIHHLDAMRRTMVHGRPILNGFHGYWPATFPARMALACRLPDAEALATLRRETGVEMVLVHLVPQPIGRPLGPYACPPLAPGTHPTPASPEQPFDPAVWEAVARSGRTDLALVARDGSDLLFRVGP